MIDINYSALTSKQKEVYDEAFNAAASAVDECYEPVRKAFIELSEYRDKAFGAHMQWCNEQMSALGLSPDSTDEDWDTPEAKQYMDENVRRWNEYNNGYEVYQKRVDNCIKEYHVNVVKIINPYEKT